ncbi:MAG TPA: ATP-binding cassette domain-containing protein [Chloroflexi bacterium]|nr:ATP-binding cassette domain-containing protein [Chloroflexota bacterium]
MTGGGWLQVRDLSVDLGEFHLRHVDLEIEAGEYFVILGPTGAGKTVLLETVAGLFHHSSGAIFLDGEEVSHTPPERRGIGFVYQDYALFPHLTVADNVAFGLKLRRVERAGIGERVVRVSELLGIGDLLHRRPNTLSGGEQQRAALARALVVEPRVLLLDEPLSALDPETREALRRELAVVQSQLGTTTLHVTHDFEEAVALGHRIAVMNEGRIVQVGSPEEIFRKPASEFVARFVGVRNIFEVQASRREDGYLTLSVDGVEILATADVIGPVHASIRPEDIVVSRERLRSSAQNCYPGLITEIADRGALVWVTVRVPPELTCMITRRSLTELELKQGMEVFVAFKASAVHVF